MLEVVCLQQPHPWSSQPRPTGTSEETHLTFYSACGDKLVLRTAGMSSFSAHAMYVEGTLTMTFGGVGLGLDFGLGGVTSLQMSESQHYSKNEKTYSTFCPF